MTGTTKGAHAVTVTLTRKGHLWARAKAQIRRGRYRAVLTVTKLARGRYTLKIALFDRHSTIHQKRTVFVAA